MRLPAISTLGKRHSTTFPTETSKQAPSILNRWILMLTSSGLEPWSGSEPRPLRGHFGFGRQNSPQDLPPSRCWGAPSPAAWPATTRSSAPGPSARLREDAVRAWQREAKRKNQIIGHGPVFGGPPKDRGRPVREPLLRESADVRMTRAI